MDAIDKKSMETLQRISDQRAEALSNAHAEIETLREKLAGAKADAERYRWLRQQHWSESEIVCVVDHKDSVKLGATCLSSALLDDFIDAAIAKQTKKEG